MRHGWLRISGGAPSVLSEVSSLIIYTSLPFCSCESVRCNCTLLCLLWVDGASKSPESIFSRCTRAGALELHESRPIEIAGNSSLVNCYKQMVYLGVTNITIGTFQLLTMATMFRFCCLNELLVCYMYNGTRQLFLIIVTLRLGLAHTRV